MSDAKKFCWAMFAGLGLGSAAMNHGLWVPRPGMDPMAAIIAEALLLGCLSIIMFGRRP